MATKRLGSKVFIDLFTDIVINFVCYNYSNKFVKNKYEGDFQRVFTLESFTDGVKEFKKLYLKAASNVRNTLQNFINKLLSLTEEDTYSDYLYKEIKDNAYSSEGNKDNFIFNKVYLKGGIIADLMGVNDFNISDLDYSCNCIEMNGKNINDKKKDKEVKQICEELFEKLKSVFFDHVPDVNEQISYYYKGKFVKNSIIDCLFGNYEKIELYNSYDVGGSLLTFNKNKDRVYNKVLSCENKNKGNVMCYAKSNIKDNLSLYRFFYKYDLLSENDNKLYVLKVNIVDLTLYTIDRNLSDNYYKESLPLLENLHLFDDVYILTCSKLAMLNDQLSTLVSSVFHDDIKITKRITRLNRLIESISINNDNIKKIKLAENFKDKNDFQTSGYILDNIINEYLIPGSLIYPFLIIPIVNFVVSYIDSLQVDVKKLYPQHNVLIMEKNVTDEESSQRIVKECKNKVVSFFKRKCARKTYFEYLYDKIYKKLTDSVIGAGVTPKNDYFYKEYDVENNDRYDLFSNYSLNLWDIDEDLLLFSLEYIFSNEQLTSSFLQLMQNENFKYKGKMQYLNTKELWLKELETGGLNYMNVDFFILECVVNVINKNSNKKPYDIGSNRNVVRKSKKGLYDSGGKTDMITCWVYVDNKKSNSYKNKYISTYY